MATRKFYHLYLVPKEDISKELIDEKLNLALDWFKYDKHIYIIYSNSELDKLTVRFNPLVQPNGRLFISELNITNRNGWMTQDFWDWLRKSRNPKLRLKPKN